MRYSTTSFMRGWRLAFMALAMLAIAPGPVRGESAKAVPAAVAKTGEQFVAAINTADGAALSGLIDVDALGSRVLANLDLNAVDRARYLASLSAQYALLGQSVVAQLSAQRAQAVLRRASSSDTGGELLVRIDTKDARGNMAHGYLQVTLDPEGRIVDWYDHSIAMSMSRQLSFSAVGMLTTAQVAQMLLGRDDGAAESAQVMQRFAAALAAGNTVQAYTVMGDMPASLKSRREFATLRVALARSVGQKAYGEALAALAKEHGTADDLQFILIDHYLLTKQNDLAMRAIDHAARVLGEDEVMDANRCHVLLELERKADALTACDRAIARNPGFDTPRWTRVRVALATKDAPLAIESLTAIEKMPGGKRFDAGDLAENEVYAWLVTQPEFAAWGGERGWSAP